MNKTYFNKFSQFMNSMAYTETFVDKFKKIDGGIQKENKNRFSV